MAVATCQCGQGCFAIGRRVGARRPDLVVVEVVGLLAAFTAFGCPIADFRQRVVAVGQDGGGTVAVEVVVVANGFGNGQVQHVVLRIVPVAFG